MDDQRNSKRMGDLSYMKLKQSLLLIVVLSMISCSQKERTKTTKQLTEVDLVKITTDFDDVLPVYSITKNIDAIVFEINDYEPKEEKLFHDKIFDEVLQKDTLYDWGDEKEYIARIRPINSIYIDTTGQLNIFRSLRLEKKIKEKLKSSYYIYGTKGYTKVTLGDVYFTVDECLSRIIAIKIIGYDNNQYGHPLFCSEKPLGLVYGTDYKKARKTINKHIDRFIDSIQADYRNKSGSTKIAAHIGSYYFTYEDDFNWKKEFNLTDLNFPSRSIYHINNQSKAEVVWEKSLDLYGIPCD